MRWTGRIAGDKNHVGRMPNCLVIVETKQQEGLEGLVRTPISLIQMYGIYHSFSTPRTSYERSNLEINKYGQAIPNQLITKKFCAGLPRQTPGETYSGNVVAGMDDWIT
jgi:hypothetical protein